MIVCFYSVAVQAASDGELEESTRADLTDQEQHEANTYVHSARNDRLLQESCKNNKDYSDICDNDQYAFDQGAGQTIEMMIPIVSKAWALFGNFEGMNKLTYTSEDHTGSTIYQDAGGQDLKKVGNDQKTGEALYNDPNSKDPKNPSKIKESELADKEGVKEKEEQKADYCTYIPMVGETAATAFQAIQTMNAQSQFDQTDPNNRQIAALRAVKKSHEDRSISSWVQTGVWGATGACYVAALATGASFDFQMGAKLGASLLFTTFFGLKASEHKKRANRIQSLIDSMPKQGDCNPHTDTTCFCAEKSSYEFDPTNYAKYCMPKSLLGRGPGHPMVCVNEHGKVDEKCVCKASGTCANKRLKLAQLELGLDPTKIDDAFTTLKPVSEGVIGNDFQAANDRNRQRMLQALKQFKPKKIPNFNLTNDQKKLAKGMTGLGIPPALAAYMASQKSGSATPASISSPGLGNAFFDKNNSHKRIGDSDLQFDSNGPSNSWGKGKKSSRGIRGAKRGKKNKNENLDGFFADKAAEKAAIHQDKGQIIFDIITYRYKLSAWKRFEDKLTLPDLETSKEPASEATK